MNKCPKCQTVIPTTILKRITCFQCNTPLVKRLPLFKETTDRWEWVIDRDAIKERQKINPIQGTEDREMYDDEPEVGDK